MFSRVRGLLLALLLTTALVQAQVSTSTLSGTVSDPSGAVVPRADVTVTNIETNFTRTTATDAEGHYLIQFLPVGTYRIEVKGAGFKNFSQTGVVIDVARNARVDAVLQIGVATENVVVEADAAAVNTADAQIGRTVQNKEITSMPLVNRDVYKLLDLTPGVEMNTLANTVGFRQYTVSINGSGDGGAGSVAYYLDGGSNMTGLRNTGNVAPNPDAVEQFRVITNSYSAEFGRFTAGVVDVVTKSGTNSLHGSLFEFLRNDKLNATPWNALSKAPLRRNQFGGSAGGPIKKDKVFVFGSYSGLRERQVQYLNGAIVPTALERQGDFSASKVKPTDPTNKAAYPNNVIPASQLDKVAMKIISDYVPQANLANQGWQGTVPNPLNSNDVNAKVDYLPTSSHQVTGSYFFTRGEQSVSGGGNMPWSVQTFSWQQQNFNAGDTWTLSPAAINQFRVTYVRNFGGRLNTPGIDLGDLGSTFRIQGVKSLPAINVSSAMNFGQAIQGPIAGSNYYGIRDSVSWTKSRHSLKFGVDASLEKFIQDTSLNNYSTWSFDGKKTGSSLADFMVGLPASFKQDTPTTKIDNDWYTGIFVQDDFRVHPRLMLNLGLRYELPTSMTDPFNRKMAFAPGVHSMIAPSAPVGLLFPGDPGIDRGIINPSRKMFAPRFGLAWDPFGDGKTSIRTAAGVFYGSISSNNMNLTTDYQPFSARQTFANVKTLADPYGNMPGGSPFPIIYDPKNPRFIVPADVSTLATNFHFPYTYQLNFSIQRQVRSDITVATAYVGALTHHLPFSVDRNYAPWTPGATTANLPNRRPYLPGTLGIIYYEDGIINSAYHGWQTTVDKRLSHGLSLKAFYVFSKSLEGAQSQNNQPTGGAENFNNLAIERGRTNNDRRHTFNLSGIWEINYLKGSHAAVRTLLNGWTVSAIAVLRSGVPNTITTGSDTNVDGSNNDRADLIGNPFLDPNRPRSQSTQAWFNTAAFANPVLTVRPDGNAGRNIIDNPGSRNVDLGLFRNFRLREQIALEFRAEMTNAFNMVNLPGPTTAFNSANFGKIVGTQSNMRQSQMGLRLTW